MTAQQIAFEEAISYLLDNGREQILVVEDLRKVMQDQGVDPYTVKWMKKKLLARFPDTILICNQNGKNDVILLVESVNSILSKLRSVVSMN